MLPNRISNIYVKLKKNITPYVSHCLPKAIGLVFTCQLSSLEYTSCPVLLGTYINKKIKP